MCMHLKKKKWDDGLFFNLLIFVYTAVVSIFLLSKQISESITFNGFILFCHAYAVTTYYPASAPLLSTWVAQAFFLLMLWRIRRAYLWNLIFRYIHYSVLTLRWSLRGGIAEQFLLPFFRVFDKYCLIGAGKRLPFLTWSICLVFQDRKMPPKRTAKRRSPPEDALPKSKKVKGKLTVAYISVRVASWSPQNLGLLPPGHLKLRSLEVQDLHPAGGSCSLLSPTVWES